MNVSKIFGIIFAIVLLATFGSAASLSLSLNSLSPIGQGSTTTLTATVSASGGSVSGAQVQLTLPAGLSTSSSTTQTIGSMSNGQSSQKSWTINGDAIGSYTLTVVATGSGVSAQSSNTTLSVVSPAFITVTENTTPASSANTGDTLSHAITLSNTGGLSTTASVVVTTSNLTMVTGSSSWSSSISAGGNVSLSWTYTQGSGGTGSIAVAITSSANDPSDLSHSITCSDCGGGTATSNTSNITYVTPVASITSGQASSAMNTAKSTQSTTLSAETVLEQYNVTVDSVASTYLTQAKTKLTKAQTEYDSGNYSYAQQLANQANTLLSDAYNKIPIVTVVTETTNPYTPKNISITRDVKVLQLKNRVTSELTNQTNFIINVKNVSGYALEKVSITETIPKSVASNVSQLTFYPSQPIIVQADPVVRWDITYLSADETQTFTYKVADAVTTSEINQFDTPAVTSQFRPLICEDYNPCTTEKQVGIQCVYTNVADGTSCGANKVCSAGICIASTKPSSAVQAGVAVPTEAAFDMTWLLIVLAVVVIAGAVYYTKSQKRKPKSHALTYRSKKR